MVKVEENETGLRPRDGEHDRQTYDDHILNNRPKMVQLFGCITNVTQVFLGWNAPPLPAAAEELVRRYRHGATLDLSRTIVVVPGKRAGRGLCELLVNAASCKGLLFTPPEVVTESSLPERLYRRQKPFASPLVRQLAWTAALRGLEPSLQQSLIPHPPHSDDHLRWFRIGEMIGKMHVELSADGHDVDTVLGVAETLTEFVDHDRWRAIRAASQAYHDALHNHGLRDENSARLTAIEKCEMDCDFDIILIGTVDLNTVVTTMLRQVAGRVTAFVVAPEEEKDRFDEFGLLKPNAWKDYPLPIGDEQVLYAEDPAGQAAIAAAWLVGLDGRFSIEDVAIGVPDPVVVPALRRRLAKDDIRVHWVEERTIADTSPYRLLAAAARYATQKSYEAFAALVRHPDVAKWLREEGTAIDLNVLDGFHNTYLPIRMDGLLLEPPELVRQAIGRVEGLLSDAAGQKPLRDWAGMFAVILKAVYCGYGDLVLDCEADRNLHASLEGLLDVIESLEGVPPALDQPLSAMDAFTVSFEGVGGSVLPPLADQDAIELLGWLELTLDNAAAVLVTSFNEGFVPTSAGADPFLPDTLRSLLGIEHNTRRYARDAYTVTVLARSKQRFACIVARRDGEHNPLVPSRLLFTGPDTEMICRAMSWAKGGGSSEVARQFGTDRTSPFEVPRPTKGKSKPRSFSVTEFRTYLACKYRYYLKHVEKLSAMDDSLRELDGRGFGALIHEVLEGWGNDPDWRHCGDAGQLADHLIGRLRALAVERFRPGRPAVHLQIAQAARRLKEFAGHQTGLIAQGWRIVFAESGRTSLEAEFTSQTGESARLRGRIDRIDYHERDNIVRILDYKTSDKAVSPDKAHRKQEHWTDLQLPLYRHLWRRAVPVEIVPESAKVQLAYFQLPRESDDTNVAVAEEWGEKLLEQADQVAREVIAAILAEEFWPPTEPAPELFDEYAAICLDNLQVPSVKDEEEA